VYLLALTTIAGVLMLGRWEAHAQPTKPAVQGAGAAAGNKPAAPAAQTTTAAAPAGNAENGKRLFLGAGCYQCHDREGQGGNGTGPRLAPNPIAFTAFVHQCRQPAVEMPPYTAKVISDAELADIYAYLQSIPKPPAASSIPLLQ
jgi:mono/diheme cytochrome c family protein